MKQYRLITEILCSFLIWGCLSSLTPPKSIPSEFNSAFTTNGKIQVLHKYIDDSIYRDQPIVFSKDQIKYYSKMASSQSMCLSTTDIFLYQALNKYKAQVEDRNVAVLNSLTPVYESILLCYGAYPTTISEKPVICDDSKIETLSQEEAEQRQFDAIISIATFDSAGLGRYGDQIDPNADLKAMEKAKSLLKEDGLLFLSVPVGQDCLIWNQHRVYGSNRLKILLKGWRIVEYFGFTSENLGIAAWDQLHQPIFVLKPISNP